MRNRYVQILYRSFALNVIPFPSLTEINESIFYPSLKPLSMENLNGYLIILLCGMILGAWIFSQFLTTNNRYQHYASDYNPAYYHPHYHPHSPRMGTSVLLIGLLVILAFSLFVGWQRRSIPQSPLPPAPSIEQEILDTSKEAALFTR